MMPCRRQEYDLEYSIPLVEDAGFAPVRSGQANTGSAITRLLYATADGTPKLTSLPLAGIAAIRSPPKM